MANRIKDALEPELYEYYKQNRNRYKRFASDLSLLQAKLFQGMVNDGVFPAKKHRHNWEYECDCVTWLNEVTSKICTFNDFRKLFKNRLKTFQFKSPEYYAECEKIIQENDVDFVKTSMRAKSMRNYVARNYLTHIPTKENEKIINNDVQITKTENHSTILSLSGLPGIQSHDDKYNYHIDYELTYGRTEQIPYIVTKHCRKSVYSIQSWDYQNEILTSLNMTWEEFWRKYNDYIAGMDVNSLDFKYQCFAIILEEECKMSKPIQQNETIKNEDDFEYGQFIFAAILSFFVFGGIAYVIKHLLLLAWFLFATITICVINIICDLFCLIIGVDCGMMPFTPDYMVDPLQIWQIGGWIYGAIVIIMIVGAIYYKIKNIFVKL